MISAEHSLRILLLSYARSFTTNPLSAMWLETSNSYAHASVWSSVRLSINFN